MAKKEYEPFPGIVCQRMRNIVKARRKAQSEREQTFSERDEASREIGEAIIAGQDSTEHEAAYGRAVMKLDVLAQRLKYLEGELDKCIEKADEAELPFDEPKVEMPDFKPRVKHAAAPKAKEEPKDVDGQMRIGAADNIAEGVDEHLKVSINELELDAKVEKCLIAGGFETVADLAKAIESKEGLPEIKGIGGIGQAAIEKAVKSYRKAHRKAAREAEQGEMVGNG